MEILRYPDNLLKIETGQQVKQLRLFDDDGTLKKEYSITINNSIERVLNLNEKNENQYAVEFPSEIESKLSEDIKNKICRELSGTEIRVLTAVLSLAQSANDRNELVYMEKTHQAYFEFDLSSFYLASGMDKNKHGKFAKKSKDSINTALLSLHRKEFLIPYQYMDGKKEVRGISIVPLLQIHAVEQWDDLSNRKKTQLYKMTVSGIFFNINEKQNSYFNLPVNLNNRLREINPGRPNVGIELFIKCLYQSLHCAKSNTIEYGYNKLVEIMKLEKYKKNNHHKRIKPTIEKAFKTALKLGIILKFEEAKSKYGGLKYVITLNK
ncbi:hypothetical protein [Chondrinema litorale]|uniref:hypothetical protein n=1 Tax=Chondrinema litorale TaxID=2994555 RepID=UPI002543D6CC|nr:hypothetical protein [Chondrinema litorale]UZR97261.1 hypothetical protein OQ292_25510 [Chondrinema litorale]